MKNILLLVVFFVCNGFMFYHYFIPNINKENNIDQIERILLNVKKTVPLDSKIYFLAKGNSKDNPEIYYKTQFLLAPRVIIAEKYENIPFGSYMLQVRDKKNINDSVLKHTEQNHIHTVGNEFFETILLKKNR